MKKTFLFFLFISTILFPQNTSLKKGVNLAGWFQESNVRKIKFTKFVKNDFEDLLKLGVDHVRLPINLEYMTNGSPEYIIDPLFFYLLDEVVNWCEELKLSLLLDNHTFDVNTNTQNNYDRVLIPIWRQMADHYKERSKLVYYEILNEPHGIDDSTWNRIQQQVIEAIREIDEVHTIVVGPAGWNSYNNLKFMPIYNDDNLLYTFHFYDPFLFTHQGANWTNPSFEPLANIPFPYSADKMPQFPNELKNTWVESSFYNSYKNDGTIQKVKSLIDIAKEFAESRNVPIHCGELGVYMKNADSNSRIWWHSIVIPYLESLNIPWTIWDYKGEFGLFEKGSDAIFDYDLNIKLLEAMNLIIPEQVEYKFIPDSNGFSIYSNYVEENININPWAGGIIDYYSSDTKDNNGYSIHWSGANQYNSLHFNFLHDKDITYLVNNDYEIDFWIKAAGNLNKLDIRFVDTKTGAPGDHPWRMRYTLTPFDFQNDNSWYHIQIPLKYFSEGGSWDNDAWFDPVGNFNWSEVDFFEITSEHGSFNGSEFWFDEIKISNPNAVSVEEDFSLRSDYKLLQNYPNPFNPSTTISFIIGSSAKLNSAAELVSLKIFDILGRERAVLLNERMESGRHEIIFDASKLSSGVYFYQLRSRNYIDTKKLVLIK